MFKLLHCFRPSCVGGSSATGEKGPVCSTAACSAYEAKRPSKACNSWDGIATPGQANVVSRCKYDSTDYLQSSSKAESEAPPEANNCCATPGAQTLRTSMCTTTATDLNELLLQQYSLSVAFASSSVIGNTGAVPEQCTAIVSTKQLTNYGCALHCQGRWQGMPVSIKCVLLLGLDYSSFQSLLWFRDHRLGKLSLHPNVVQIYSCDITQLGKQREAQRIGTANAPQHQLLRHSSEYAGSDAGSEDGDGFSPQPPGSPASSVDSYGMAFSSICTPIEVRSQDQLPVLPSLSFSQLLSPHAASSNAASVAAAAGRAKLARARTQAMRNDMKQQLRSNSLHSMPPLDLNDSSTHGSPAAPVSTDATASCSSACGNSPAGASGPSAYCGNDNIFRNDTNVRSSAGSSPTTAAGIAPASGTPPGPPAHSAHVSAPTSMSAAVAGFHGISNGCITVSAVPGSHVIHMVAEYCDQGDLCSFMQSGRLRAPPVVLSPQGKVLLKRRQMLQLMETATVAQLLAEGLIHLHAARIVHGALCPRNVLIQSCKDHKLGFIPKLWNYGIPELLRWQELHREQEREDEEPQEQDASSVNHGLSVSALSTPKSTHKNSHCLSSIEDRPAGSAAAHRAASVLTSTSPAEALQDSLYKAPEVLCGGPATKASDVYAFGRLLLFLFSEGQQPRSNGSAPAGALPVEAFGGFNLAAVAASNSFRRRSGKDMSAVSKDSQEALWPEASLPVLKKLGRACCKRSPKHRPSMAAVHRTLTKVVEQLSWTAEGPH